VKRTGILMVCLLLRTLGHAVETPARLFFSDAKLSFVIPEPWDVSSAFPFGPLLTRKTQEGTDAYIVCQISDPVDLSRLSVDASTDVLKNFATHDISSRTGNTRILATTPRSLAGLNAFEATWLSEGNEGVVQYQSIYFFMDNRFYVLSLRANRDSFPWIVQDFQNWLPTIHVLSRQDSGKLEAPAHGGLWVHQTGGVKIAIPDDWLIGVADDRQVGATVARDKMHLAFTATADVLSTTPKEMTAKQKEAERRTLDEKGYKVVSESDEPFHSYPCYRVTYEGTVDGRFVRGQDLWISSPKAQWLVSLEGDTKLLRQLSDEWQAILSGMHFYE
jgi:hypothetical protein